MSEEKVSFFRLSNKKLLGLIAVAGLVAAGAVYEMSEDGLGEKHHEVNVTHTGQTEKKRHHNDTSAPSKAHDPVMTQHPMMVAGMKIGQTDKLIDVKSKGYQHIHPLVMLSIDAISPRKNGHIVRITLVNVSSVDIKELELKLWNKKHASAIHVSRLSAGFSVKTGIRFKKTTNFDMLHTQWAATISGISISPKYRK